MAERFTDFLDAALRQLETDWPVGARRLGRTLGDRVVALRVGRDRCRVVGGPGPARVVRRGGDGDVEVDTDKTTLLALVDGELDVLSAARGDRLYVRGDVAGLAVFDDVLGLFVQGAVRCPSLQLLLENYRDRGEA